MIRHQLSRIYENDNLRITTTRKKLSNGDVKIVRHYKVLNRNDDYLPAISVVIEKRPPERHWHNIHGKRLLKEMKQYLRPLRELKCVRQRFNSAEERHRWQNVHSAE
jgi:hypothetical protein